ncbi:hypothetical protein [Baekduia soli]|uniref:hypothetical protein n=1 Tax=Baekduia soli TaxID=496014 RepID=UPI001E3F5BDD|nr:hypothetical protein [Baekduia soli]
MTMNTGNGTPLHPETVVISSGRPGAADGPLNVPVTPASALQPDGTSGHAPWQALKEALGALEGGRALMLASGMTAAAAAMRLFGDAPVIVAPEVA